MLQELRERFSDVAQAAAEASFFAGQDAQGGVLAHLAAKLAAKLKVCLLLLLLLGGDGGGGFGF